MRLDHRLFDTQELGTADFPVVQHLHHFIHTRLTEKVANGRQGIALDVKR